MAKYASKAVGESGEQSNNGERIVRVLQTCWLMQHGEVTVESLARRYGVSRRTIFRDLRAIAAARLPVAVIRGESGLRMVRAVGGENFLQDDDSRAVDLS